MAQSVKRLIEWFRPEHYDLEIAQDSESLAFSGTVTIKGELTKKAVRDGMFYLHSDGIHITDLELDGSSAPFTLQAQTQELSVSLPTPKNRTDLGHMSKTVRISFTGKITKPMHGLYPCFFEHEGVQKRLLATQFESHHAREVFPCVDEPEAKATFQLSLTTFKDDTVVSNTPIIEVRDGGTAGRRDNQKTKLRTTVFETTPVMSTYLLAWVSGELVGEEVVSKHGVTIRVFSTPAQASKAQFALQTCADAMDFLDDYFDIPYPLPKYDMIALPDFAAGAMENWGCVTFRESALLIDEVQSDLHDKQHVADVVIHELSHQWFGNLVTMRWWDDLWLNEGFASWIPYLVRDRLFPDWHVWEHFATGDLSIGLRADALHNTHPIVVAINSPSEIRSAFDSISYDKGCSVVNLLFRYIGPDAFRDGLRIYLKKHAYANADTADLWAAWAESSGRDVAGFMRAWTTKKGFPIVQVDGKTITQKRFILSGESDSTLWPIPLLRSEEDDVVVAKASEAITVDQHLNHGRSGFYRTLYTGQLKKDITRQLATGALPAVDALGIIDDAAEAAKAGYYPTIDALSLCASIRQTTNYNLLTTALGELSETRTILKSSFDPMKPFVATLIAPSLTRLGLEQRDGESIDDELLRPSIIASAAYSGNEAVLPWLTQLFGSAKNPEDIRPDLRSVVYIVAARDIGDAASYEKLLGWYASTTIAGERAPLANALCVFKDRVLYDRSLALITTDSVKLQDAMYWIACALGSRFHAQRGWEWLKEHWGWIGDNYGREKEIDYYLRFAARWFATDEHYTDYVQFFETVDIFGSQRAFEQGKETIRWQTAWRARDEVAVSQWLSAQS